MSIHERTLDVIQDFYDAALDESLWPSALKNLSDLTNSQAASFWVLDGSDQPRLPTFICFNFDVKMIAEYLDHVAAMDPTVQYLVAHPEQEIVHDGLVISERDKKKHPYYDWHERNIDTRFRMVGQTSLAPSVQAGVAMHRTAKAGRYGPKDIDRFAVLHGHLKRALAIAFRLGSLGAMEKLTTEWLDRSKAAIVFLDQRRRIIFANQTARVLASESDGIRFVAGNVVPSRKQDHDQLEALIAQVLSPLALPGSSAGGAMRVPRPSGKRPYGILVCPVSSKYSALDPALGALQPAACVVITDPEKQKPLPVAQLRTAFGLTEAEAKLAARLAAGDDLRIAADKLNISYGTARTRLAQIFHKTDTRRQGELIRLLLATFALG